MTLLARFVIQGATTTARNISVINSGFSNFQNFAKIKNIDGDLCNYLTIYNNITDKTQNLTNFNATTTAMTNPQDDWNFSISLNSEDADLQNQICNFDLTFKSW